MEAFNDDMFAKEAIASSPEITQTAEIHEEEAASNADQVSHKAADACAPSPDDARNARLLSACIKGVIKSLGFDTDTDQISATQELTTEGFAALSSLNPPRWMRLTLVFGLLLGSFAPVGVAAYQSYRTIKEGEENGIS